MSLQKVLILKSVWVDKIGAVAKRGDLVSIDHRIIDKWVAVGYCTRDLDYPIQKNDGDLVSQDFDDSRVDDLEQRLASLEAKSGSKSRKAKASSPDPEPDDKP